MLWSPILTVLEDSCRLKMLIKFPLLSKLSISCHNGKLGTNCAVFWAGRELHAGVHQSQSIIPNSQPDELGILFKSIKRSFKATALLQYYRICHVGCRLERGHFFERRVALLSHFTESSARKGVLETDFLKDIILTNIFYGLENSSVLIFWQSLCCVCNTDSIYEHCVMLATVPWPKDMLSWCGCIWLYGWSFCQRVWSEELKRRIILMIFVCMAKLHPSIKQSSQLFSLLSVWSITAAKKTFQNSSG